MDGYPETLAEEPDVAVSVIGPACHDKLKSFTASFSADDALMRENRIVTV